MAIDTSPLGQLTAQVMEGIDEEFGESEDWTIRTAAVIVEVDSKTSGSLVIRCSDDRPWLLAALLNEAWETTDRLRQAMLEQADAEDDE